jgi:hypothetical protein
MTDTPEANTRWVEVWIINDPVHQPTAMEEAEAGPKALEQYVTGVLRNAKPDSEPWYIARELSHSDYQTIDWEEIAATLLSK